MSIPGTLDFTFLGAGACMCALYSSMVLKVEWAGGGGGDNADRAGGQSGEVTCGSVQSP